jgi:hypothetical protein
MQRVCFVLQVSPTDSRNTKSAIEMFGLRCRPHCAKPDGAIIRCSCETMAFWSAIWRQKTLKALAPEWPKREVNERWQREMATFSFSPTECCPIAPCSRWKKSFTCNSDRGFT